MLVIMEYKKNKKHTKRYEEARTTDIPIDVKVEAVNWARNVTHKGSSKKATTNLASIYDNYQFRNWKGVLENGTLTLTALDGGDNPITNERRTVAWKAKYADTHIKLISSRKNKFVGA